MTKEKIQSSLKQFKLLLSDYKNKEPEKFFQYRTLGIIVLATLLLITISKLTKPEPKTKPITEATVQVETLKAEATSYPIIISSSGTIEAVTRSSLVAQIQGQVIKVANSFKSGGAFKKGDILLEIDDRDYQANLSSALATLSQAKVNIEQEQANSKQAERDWKRLGYTKSAPDLVLRKPQLAAAQAQLDSAQAALEFAKLQLSRTKITAPYDGRLISKRVDLGQFVSIGNVLGEAFASDSIEVKLPISQSEFALLELNTNTNHNNFPVAILSTRYANTLYEWSAEITRAESSINTATRQINVIATIENPFSTTNADKPSLKIGQFVDASIQGKQVNNAFVIPNTSMREGDFVYLIKNGRLTKQRVSIVWQDDENTVISDGLQNGDQVVLTALTGAAVGAKAKITNPSNTQKPETQQVKKANDSGKRT